MTPYLSQIARLLKSILLRPADASKRPSAQFVPGKHTPFTFSGGIAVSWWYSEDTFRAIDAVAALTIESSSDFRDCDVETVASAVTSTLQELCLDKNLFHGDAVFLGQRDTLFDCRKTPPPELATAISEAIATNLRARIGRRCTIYAVPRIRTASFELENDSVQVIAKADADAWQKLIEKGFEFDGWSPLRPQVGDRQDRTYAPPSDFECVLVAEERGTSAGAKFNSVLRFRKLAAVVHAVASKDSPHRIHKSMARPFDFLVQFPHGSIHEGRITRSDCAPVIPYFASDVQISSEGVESVRAWYDATGRCDKPHRDRVEKAANFLNRGLNAEDIEAYINYFVALDALFGQRGSVEASILEGVESLELESAFSEKAEWLFDLRNEIVHGGSRYVSEWPKYPRYTQHFRSKPMDDVRVLAQLAVLGAPQLFAS